MRSLVAGILIAVLAGAGMAEVERITVLGLFKDKAVVRIDGKRRLLRAGEPSPEGVVLISADSEGAVLEVGGERRTYSLGTQVSTRYAQAPSNEVRIWRNAGGMYTTVGSINGHPVDFMVDTGATMIAMNANQARLLGIDFRLEGEQGMAHTASGAARVYRVTLDRVGVGEILLHNVDAVVLEGSAPRVTLLGMSFLGRLQIEHDGKAMVLRQRP